MRRLAPRTVGVTVAAGLVLLASVQPAQGYDPLAGDYSREDPLDVRVMTYNHAGNFIDDPGSDAEFGRIIAAIDPDVICFQEFPSGVSTSEVVSRMNSLIPIGGTGWKVHFGLLAGVRTAIVSRYPLLLTRTDTVPASSTRGVTIALVNLPDADYALDLYLLGVHLKCCGDPGGSEDQSRQKSADAIANWLGDARGVIRPSGDNVILSANTPIIALGDFNLVGGPQPGNTILTGDILDNGVYGPDVSGDWDSTNLTDLLPADPFTGNTFTWQGNGTYPPSALDHMFFTDSAITVANSFIFNTNTMTPAARIAAGVQAGDTLPANSSDHLPVVADLRYVALSECIFDSDCDDANPCNGDETCVDNACVAGTALACDDGNPCTNDECVAFIGCQNVANADPCDDGNACTTDDTCSGGACSGTAQDCDDGVFCTGGESCDAQLGCLPGTNPCLAGTWCDEGAAACVPFGDGDFDGDGDADLHDFAAFQACFGPNPTPACAAGNLVGSDAAIDAADLAAFIDLLED